VLDVINADCVDNDSDKDANGKQESKHGKDSGNKGNLLGGADLPGCRRTVVVKVIVLVLSAAHCGVWLSSTRVAHYAAPRCTLFNCGKDAQPCR
jgi:hypothetical protein